MASQDRSGQDRSGQDPSGQSWDAGGYAHHARFVADFGLPLVDLLAPCSGERVLDLGCGDGALTETVAARGATVIGVDASLEMVAAARARGLDVRCADGQALPFHADFDAVISNAALHWMTRPDSVLAGVRRALKPGGRFIGEMGGAGNVAKIGEALNSALARRGVDPAAVWPWYFPSVGEYRAKLEATGFTVVRIELFERPTPLPTGMVGWLATFAGRFLAALPADQRDSYVTEVADALAPALRTPEGNWVADYVRLRFVATLSPPARPIRKPVAPQAQAGDYADLASRA
ncbi:MAG: methyltransferase domain-containing protein [Azospirillum sp.]|nr:methyltransferase domain-containing protein [Azospirillum sp.]